MKKIISLLLLVCTYGIVCAQIIESKLPLLNNGEILFLGEDRFLEEIQETELNIVNHYAENNQNVVVFVDLPSCYNHFTNEIRNGKSDAFFKEFLINSHQYYKAKYIFEFVDKICSSNKNVKLICISGNKSPYETLCSIHNILKEYYDLPDYYTRFDEKAVAIIRNYRQNGNSNTESENLIKELQLKINNDNSKLKAVLSESDFDFLRNILNDVIYDEDKNIDVMAQNIDRNFNSNACFLAIVNVTNANKSKIVYDAKYSENAKPLAQKIDNNSKFSGKVSSICLESLNFILPEVKMDDGKIIPAKSIVNVFNQIPDDIKQNCNKQNTDIFIEMSNSNNKEFDGFIILKQAHSSIPGNIENINGF